MSDETESDFFKNSEPGTEEACLEIWRTLLVRVGVNILSLSNDEIRIEFNKWMEGESMPGLYDPVGSGGDGTIEC